jgi:hypothetical protein
MPNKHIERCLRCGTNEHVQLVQIGISNLLLNSKMVKLWYKVECGQCDWSTLKWEEDILAINHWNRMNRTDKLDEFMQYELGLMHSLQAEQRMEVIQLISEMIETKTHD